MTTPPEPHDEVTEFGSADYGVPSAADIAMAAAATSGGIRSEEAFPAYDEPSDPVEVLARRLHFDIATAGSPHLPPSGQAARADVDWENRPEADRELFRRKAAGHVAAIEPVVATRVRAQVAEEIAEIFAKIVKRERESLGRTPPMYQVTRDQHRIRIAAYEHAGRLATIAREHGRPAAGTDQPQDRTEEKPEPGSERLCRRCAHPNGWHKGGRCAGDMLSCECRAVSRG